MLPLISLLALLFALAAALLLGYQHHQQTHPQTQDGSAGPAGSPARPTAKTASSGEFLHAITDRRTIYALSDKPILPNDQLVKLVQETVRQSPSAFNSQSSRVIILLGPAHKKFWSEQIKQFGSPGVVSAMSERLPLFAAGQGTLLFFEDQATIATMQERNAAFAPVFPAFSAQSSGMAQVNTWTALTQAGYGANLQHLGSVSGEDYTAKLSAALGFPPSWKPISEMVFGSVEKPAGDKTYMQDTERFKVVV